MMNQLNELHMAHQAPLYCPECHEVLTLKEASVSFEAGKPCNIVWGCESCGQKENVDYVWRYKLDAHLDGSSAEKREALERLVASYETGIMDVKALAKANLKRAEQARTLAQIRIESAKKELDAVVAEMAQFGITPDTIQMEIDKLQVELEGHLARGLIAADSNN